MSKVDIDIYVSQVIRFFESNPDDLKTLIGDLDKETFYERMKEDIIKNDEEKNDPTLTRQQMIDIVVKLYKERETVIEPEVINAAFFHTEFGDICLN
jgi:hypothetical protein